jgi:hypothetical protein
VISWLGWAGLLRGASGLDTWLGWAGLLGAFGLRLWANLQYPVHPSFLPGSIDPSNIKPQIPKSLPSSFPLMSAFSEEQFRGSESQISFWDHASQ